MPDRMMPEAVRCVLLVPSLQFADVDLAWAFVALGARPPQTSLPPGSDASPGLLSARIEQFHAQLADEFGDANAGDGSLDSWALRERFAASLPALLEHEFGDAKLPLLTSPGLFRYMQYWLSALRQLAIAPKVIVPIRAPTDIEDLAALRRMLDLERQTRGFDRVLVPGDQHIDDGCAWAQRVASELDLRWPILPATVATEVGVALQRQVLAKGDQPDSDDPEIPALAGIAHAALLRIAGADSAGLAVEYAILDRIRQALDAGNGQAKSATSEHRSLGMAAIATKSDETATNGDERLAVTAPLSIADSHDLGMHARAELALLSCRRELAQVREAQEALMEQASQLPKMRLERDEMARHLARQLLVAYRQNNGPDALDARLTLRSRIGRILRRGRPGAHEQALQQRWQQIGMIEASPLFDGGWYLRKYVDVAMAGASPAEHYLLHGAQEGRNPGPQFDTAYYLERYPDVAESGANPLVHYLSCGAAEGRLIRPGQK